MPLCDGSGEIDAGAALRESAGRLLAGLDTQAFSARDWATVVEAGLPAAMLPEASGGFGVEVPDAVSLLRLVGTYAVALPLAETMLAGWLLAAVVAEVPEGPMTVAQGAAFVAAGGRVRGTAWGVKWGRHCGHAVLVCGGVLALVPIASCAMEPGSNIAGEPVEALRFDVACETWGAPLADEAVRAAGAGLHAMMLSGAVQAVLDMTVAYAGERVQFGKPIGRFQAVQQSLAELAGHAAAAAAASDTGAEAFPAVLAQAVAKIRAGEAAGKGAAIGHQVHGAIGFTEEYRLHRWTRRLWAWRDEWGSEAQWARVLGRHMAEAGPERLWAEVAAL